LGGFKTLIVAMGLILGACLILPCLVPLVLRSIRAITEAITERKMASHVMMLWKYKRLDQGDAL
jgi:ABC-type tungstate transport system substrate-binding protein